ncbi:MAG: acyl carrier protein [Fluviibacter sp.]
MTTASTLKILRDFLQERTEIEPSKIVPVATLEELGIDSLMQLELLFEFEEKLEISLPNVEERPKTIGELIALVEQHIASIAPEK